MIRDKERVTNSTHILLYLLAAKGLVETALAYPSFQKAFYPEVDKYYKNKRLDDTLRRLYKQGWLRTEYIEAKKIISLTKRGEIEALFQKAFITKKPANWDGKWRVVMFDIPEGAKNVRQKLRLILRKLGFKALQASVYIYPYPVSTASVEALRKSGLMRYIRIARADFDDDVDLRKLFHLLPAKKRGRT